MVTRNQWRTSKYIKQRAQQDYSHDGETWRQRGLEHWFMQSQLHLELLLVAESGTRNGLPWRIISHSTGSKKVEDTWRHMKALSPIPPQCLQSKQACGITFVLTCIHKANFVELDDGWPESEKDVFQAALSMVVVKNSRWTVGEFYMSYGGIRCEK